MGVGLRCRPRPGTPGDLITQGNLYLTLVSAALCPAGMVWAFVQIWRDSDDGVQVVLLQPEEEEFEYHGEGDDDGEGEDAEALLPVDTEVACDSTAGCETVPAGMTATSSATGGGMSATPTLGAAAASSSRHKKYVAPHLQGGTGAAGAKPMAKLRPSISAAQKAKFGPLLHVPGGMAMSFEPPLPENIDIDQLVEKPWRKPEVDLTDYFNYGAQISAKHVRGVQHIVPEGSWFARLRSRRLHRGHLAPLLQASAGDPQRVA